MVKMTDFHPNTLESHIESNTNEAKEEKGETHSEEPILAKKRLLLLFPTPNKLVLLFRLI